MGIWWGGVAWACRILKYGEVGVGEGQGGVGWGGGEGGRCLTLFLLLPLLRMLLCLVWGRRERMMRWRLLLDGSPSCHGPGAAHGFGATGKP